MIYPNLHAILATRIDGLIGDGDRIPWHHSGDMKHFKEVTMGATLIMGLKTVEGIAKNYFHGKELLPGRRIYVTYSYRQSDDVGRILKATGATINWKNIVPVCIGVNSPNIYVPNGTTIHPDDPARDIRHIMETEAGRKVFIAGGAKTYERYIQFCNTVYLTLIRQEWNDPEVGELGTGHEVYLTHPVQHLLFSNPYGYEMKVLKPPQAEVKADHTITASILQIAKLKYDDSLTLGSFTEL